MKYNLSKYSQTISNTTEGDISLTTTEVISILNSTLAGVDVPASGTTSGTLVLDCDLGARIHIDQIKYYFTPTSISGSEIVSSVKFYAKNESFETYISLDTYLSGSYFYATMSGTSAPRYIRVEHTVASGAGGQLNGFEVLNNDTYVDFGDDGTKTQHNVEASIENALVEINEMQVYNSGPSTANAKLVLEPQGDASDDVLYISDSSSGPWYGIYEDDDKISGSSTWDSGTMVDVYELDDTLKLTSGALVGTYTTRVFETADNQKLTRLIMSYNYPIALTSVEFLDDFPDSTSEDNYIFTGISSSDLSFFPSEGRMRIASVYDTDEFRTVDQSLDFGDDWYVKIRSRWHRNYSFAWRYYFTSSCRIDFRYSDNGPNDETVYIYIGGQQVWDAGFGFKTSEIMDEDCTMVAQRNFNTFRFKVWKTSNPEPSAWDFETGISPTDIATSGHLRFDCIANNYNTVVDFWHISLIKNYTSSNEDEAIVAVDAVDTTETIEVRSSNSEPMEKNTYIRMSGSYGSSTKYTDHYWTGDGSLAERSSDWGAWGQSGNYWEYWYDSIADDEYIVDKPYYTGGSSTVYHRVRRKSGSLNSQTISSISYGTGLDYNTYKWVPNQTGGSWIYYYIGSNYTLRYYDSSLSTVYEKTATAAQGTFIYDFDCCYYDTNIWYTDNDLYTVFKLNTAGDTVASYLATDDVRGIVALADGTCWFIQEQALIHLDSNADFVESITLPTSTASYIYLDPDGDGYWLHDGYVVRHIDFTGTENFNIEIDYLYHITPMHGGVLTKHHDGTTTNKPKASFISKAHRRVLREWDYPTDEGGLPGIFDYNRFGARSHRYDDTTDDHAAGFPIAIDTGWEDSEWVPVSLRDFNLTNDEYHQVRITLRANNSTNSPRIYGLWTQRAIEIPDIYPGNYGRFYLKTDVSNMTAQDVGNYVGNIKAYWYLDAE